MSDTLNSSSKSKMIEFLKGSTILVLSNICLKAINFFLLPLYTKHLTPQMLGISDAVTTFTGILLPLLTLGFDSAYSAFYFDDEENRKEKVYSTLTICFFVSGLIPMLMMFAAKPFSMLLFGTENYTGIVIMALFSLSFNLWFLPFSLELRLQNRMLAFGLGNVIASLLMVGLNILFVSVLKLGESSLILSAMIVHFQQILFYAFVVRKKVEKRFFDKSLLKKMAVFALPLVPMSIMTWILSLSDRYIILHYLGEDAVGIYGIGTRFTTMLNVVISAVQMAYTTFAFSSKDDEGADRQYYYIFCIESAVLLIVSFGIALFSNEIVAVMTDSSYKGAEGPLRDLMFAQSLFAMTTIVGYGISFAKKSKYLLYATTAASVVNIVLNFVFVPEYGINAAAATTLIGFAVDFVIVYYFSEKLYPCDYGLKRVAVIFAALYLISFFCSEMSLMIKSAVFVLAFALVMFIFRDLLKTITAGIKSVTAGKRKRGG